MFTPEEKRELLRIAREAISDALESRQAPDMRPAEGALARPSGAFVTLRLNQDLRGCIGYIESNEPVRAVIAEVAVRAAFDDPRFPPLTAEEFRNIHIEISVLSPLRQIRDIGEIEVGVHGLVLELGQCRGLLLPQVATEYGWDRLEFLGNVSRKAGLPRTAWSDPGARIFVFSAEVFEEEGASVP